MMSTHDIAAGFGVSRWPAECGGPMRQKLSAASMRPREGLRGGERAGERLAAHHRDNGRWNVMFVWRGEDLYAFGTTALGDPSPHGWVELIDSLTLQPLAGSPTLPCGGHTWCGALALHRNGDLYAVNGSYMHRLTPALEIAAERELPVDGAHNGLLIMPDGNIVTKDLRLEGAASTFSVLEPDRLDVISTHVMAEPSMGRITAGHAGGRVVIYAPGDEHVFRFVYDAGRLTPDPSWQPRYRTRGETSQGLAWDTCMAGDSVWMHDNGDIGGVHDIFSRHPAGAGMGGAAGGGGMRHPFTGKQRLLRFRIDDARDRDEIVPFGRDGAFVIAPPLVDPARRIAVAFDTGNGRVAAYRYGDGAPPTRLWEREIRNWWQPMLFADGVLVLDDFDPGRTQGDEIVLIDIETGEELGRTPTGGLQPNGMFPAPGRDRDLYFCTMNTLARVYWANDL